MTQEQLDQLQQVNEEVNRIPYDAIAGAHEPYDWWTDTPGQGSYECRDYVLTKSEHLQSLGWPQSSMTVVLCYDELGEYHAVLAVEVDGETWILDNRAQDVYPLNKPPYAYRWDRRQIAGTTDFESMSPDTSVV